MPRETHAAAERIRTDNTHAQTTPPQRPFHRGRLCNGPPRLHNNINSRRIYLSNNPRVPRFCVCFARIGFHRRRRRRAHAVPPESLCNAQTPFRRIAQSENYYYIRLRTYYTNNDVQMFDFIFSLSRALIVINHVFEPIGSRRPLRFSLAKSLLFYLIGFHRAFTHSAFRGFASPSFNTAFRAVVPLRITFCPFIVAFPCAGVPR